MPALYSIATSPLLTGASAMLREAGQESALDAWARVAERLLGFTSPQFGDPADVQLAKDAVALQVAYAYNLGMERFGLTSESRGGRSMSYKDVMLNPMAVEMASILNAQNGRDGMDIDPSRFANITSFRGTDGTEGVSASDLLFF